MTKMAAMLNSIVVLSVIITFAHAQTCNIRAESFENEFCKIKEEVDILKADSTAVANTQVEISRLWHTIQSETKNVYDNQKAIAALQHNMSTASSGVNVGPADLQNFTSEFNKMLTNISNLITTLEERLTKLEVKCSTCSPGGHPCTYHPCKNGGKCVELGKDYYCACPVGFDGKDCDAQDHCLTSPCLNNGTCVNNIVGHKCVCDWPYTGQNCSIELGICDTNPCAHGLCVPDGKTNYKCLCSPGFYGDMCNSLVDLSALTTKSTPKTTNSLSSKTTVTSVGVTSQTTTVSSVNPSNAMTNQALTSVTANSTSQTSPVSTNITMTTLSTPTSPHIHGGIATAHNPCSDTSLCNQPSKCVPKGMGYVCQCPETNKTQTNPCLEPYYLEMYALCCMKDTCQPGTDPIC